ncbi:MAG TPA: M56 family metallopeptidase [Longimicrobium sp.]
MTAWMLFSAAVSALAGLAALAAERALRLHRLPTRWVWAMAIVASLALPVVLPAPPSNLAGGGMLEMTGAAPSPISNPDLSTVEMRPAAGATLRARIDGMLPWAWGMASAAVAGALAVAALRLARRRRTWAQDTVAGERVWVSDAVGPAVVGFVRPRIVLPRWTLAWAEPLQRLILRHEREHVRAGDPRLLLGGLVSVALMPWSPALWWQLRRLRLAVEVDCDARTLRGEADVLAYGRLLLEVGRLGGGSPAPLVAFSEPRSFLEQRIDAMTSRIPRDRARRVLAWTTLGALAAVTGAALPVPTQPRVPLIARRAPAALPAAVARRAPETRPAVSQRASATLPAAPARPERVDTSRVMELREVDRQPALSNSDEVQQILERAYPPLLRDAGVQGSVTMDVIVGADGAVRSARVSTTSHDGFREPALFATNAMRFRPAAKDGRAVPVRFTLPIAFRLQTGPPFTGGVARPDEVAGMRQSEAWIRRELAARYPRIASEGTAGRQYVWFLVDPAGRVLQSGTGAKASEGSWDLGELEPQIRQRFPDVKVQSVFWGAVHVAGDGSPTANVAWITTER